MPGVSLARGGAGSDARERRERVPPAQVKPRRVGLPNDAALGSEEPGRAVRGRRPPHRPRGRYVNFTRNRWPVPAIVNVPVEGVAVNPVELTVNV